jgi:2,5-diamino-6-(ribosylamino)-4(3H)-pyrimidinone 5'-phosphate reductase
LERLERKSDSGIPIVVEGKNDVHALHLLGITGDIILAKSYGKSLLDVLGEIERMGKSEVILLFDFDRRGREWTHRMSRYLEGMKIKANLLFWRKLLGLVGSDVKDIEGLPSFLETLKTKYRGSKGT